MRRQDAYKLPNKEALIFFLEKNGFSYNPHRLGVFSLELKDPIIANIVQEGVCGTYLIMEADSEVDGGLKVSEKNRLRELVESFQQKYF